MTWETPKKQALGKWKPDHTYFLWKKMMASLTTLKDNKGGPWCLQVGLIWAHYLPKSNLLSCTDLSQYAALDLHSQKQKKFKSIENNVNREWNEESSSKHKLFLMPMTQHMTW
jgi:hypothetical protein